MSKIIIVCVILFAIFIFTSFVNNSNQDEHNDLDKDIAKNLSNYLNSNKLKAPVEFSKILPLLVFV